jgi:hypothetical protein
MFPFFRLASAIDMRKANLTPANFFSSQNVTHIRLNESRYAKVGEDDAVGKKDAGSEGETLFGGAGREEFEDLPLNELLRKLVDKSVSDPTDRSYVFNRALSLVKEQIDNAVEKVLVEFNREKTRLSNEQARTENVIGTMA